MTGTEARLVYKIVDRSSWQKAEARGTFDGAPVDLEDGFIHFSTAAQVRETATKHFAGQEDLLLIALETAVLGKALKWEPSRGGDLFPHLYASLSLGAVQAVHDLPLDAAGQQIFPEGLD